MNEARPYTSTNHLTTTEKSKIIFQFLEGSELYWSLRHRVKEEILKNKQNSNDISDAIPRILKDLNLDSEIRNAVFEIYENNLKNDSCQSWSNNKFKDCENTSFLPTFFLNAEIEPLESIVQAKSIWSDFLKQRFMKLIKILGKPAVRYKNGNKNSSKDRSDDIELDDEPKEDENYVRHILYEPSTLLNAIFKMKSENFAGPINLNWGNIRVLLQTRSLEDLRKKYSELNIFLRQIGVDDEKSFVDERILIGERLIQKNSVPYLVQFAKRGVPPCLRSQIYKKTFGLEIGEKEMAHFDKVQDNFNKYELMIDEILYSDLREVCNDDKYFVFEEAVGAVVNLLLRDPWLLTNCRLRPHTPIVGYSYDHPIGCIPPSGILPCFLFSRYVAPLAYISEKIPDIYYIARSLYAKYFCCLHSISSNSQSILGLSKLFEDLLQVYEPEVCYHMQQIGISPLKIAFPWIFYAFVGYLEVDQIFLLWDRIIGFDSLEIIPILAAAIFVFRANLILNCTTQEEFDEIFYDLTQIKVMPLIQHFLFATGIN